MCDDWHTMLARCVYFSGVCKNIQGQGSKVIQEARGI